MRNPARVVLEKLDPNIYQDLAESMDAQSLEGARKVSVLGMVFFGASGVLWGWHLADSVGELSVEAQTPAGQIAESAGEVLLLTPGILSEVVIVSGGIEMTRLNRVITSRMRELGSGQQT